MEAIENKLIRYPQYETLLGKQQALSLFSFFEKIEGGTYDKRSTITLNLTGMKHPITLRCIRADMQSFINTFIDPYLDKKPYLNKADFVIDGGANIGLTAALFASWWPDATIVSIEPDKENFDLTLKNVEGYKNVHVIHAGLWNKNAKLKIEAGQEDGFVVKEIAPGDSTVQPENVSEGISINSLCEKFNKTKIDFLKLNVEGSEKELFEEAYQLWLPNTNAMLIELHDGKNAGCSKSVFKTIVDYPFAVAETAPYGILFVEETTYRKWYADWYREEIYKPRINKDRFPQFYLDSN
jgi:FkbM family methyltransferase